MTTERSTSQGVYIADDELVIAAKVAMELGQPLLLTGEPGTGKTTFAGHLAANLAPEFFSNQDSPPPSTTLPLHKFETKSTSVATDVFYRFDSMRRFQAAHDPKMSADNRDYIAFEALGEAILQSLAWNEVSDLVPERIEHLGPRRSVVLIDEIDKAPRDFPNDLLNEIDQLFFRIPELTDPRTQRIRRVVANPALRPVIVVTSNSERNLPAPFLRRCIFHHIQFPDRDHKERLVKILKANLAGEVGKLADSAINFFYDIREELQLEKLPTSHELQQWVRVLHGQRWLDADLDPKTLQLADLPPHLLKATFGVIAKTAGDIAQVEQLAGTKLRR
jgi:MoxR-like ATPase